MRSALLVAAVFICALPAAAAAQKPENHLYGFAGPGKFGDDRTMYGAAGVEHIGSSGAGVGLDSLVNGALIGAAVVGVWCAIVCGQGLDSHGQLPLAVVVNVPTPGGGAWRCCSRAVPSIPSICSERPALT